MSLALNENRFEAGCYNVGPEVHAISVFRQHSVYFWSIDLDRGFCSMSEIRKKNEVIIDCEAGEIIHLVASVCVFVHPFGFLRALRSWLGRIK